MPKNALLRPDTRYALPADFDFHHYIDAEREFWALFPETTGMRVSMLELGLSAEVYVESFEDGGALRADEIYMLLPCPDGLRPVRMRALLRLNLSEYRLAQLTVVKLAGSLRKLRPILTRARREILGPELTRDLLA